MKIFLIDGYNFLYRMFYAVPPFSTKSGIPVNAVFGLAKTLLWIHEYDEPDLLYFVMDSGKSFRVDVYPEYKAHRDRMPDNLKIQEKIIFELLESLDIKPLTAQWFEADDIIGTLAIEFSKTVENDIYILSGDKDLYQFTGPRVAVYDMMKRTVSREKETIEKFWIAGKYVVDYLAICGDSSDNIPGIPGFGPKKAQELISKYGTLEEIYAHLDEITGKTRETLETSREVAFLSKRLAQIHTEVPVNITDTAAFTYKNRDLFSDRFIEFLRKYEFKSLLPKHAEIQTKDITSLGLYIHEITTPQELLDLDQKLEKFTQIGFATLGKDFSELDGVSLSLDEDVYWLDPKLFDLRNFLKNLLSSNRELVGFDIKPDLKRIWYYLENETTPTGKDITPGQISLF